MGREKFQVKHSQLQFIPDPGRAELQIAAREGGGKMPPECAQGFFYSVGPWLLCVRRLRDKALKGSDSSSHCSGGLGG